MSTDRDFDRLTRAWLDLMPDEAPDHAVAAVIQAVETTPQVRRASRWLPWRLPAMNRAPVLIGAAAVIAVAGLGVLFASSPSGPPAAGQPSPTISPSVSSSPAADAGIPGELVGRWMGGHRPLTEGDAGTTILFRETDIAVAQANAGNRPLLTSSAAVVGSGQFRLEATVAIGGCAAGSVGLYDWTLSAGNRTLTISPVRDECASRSQTLEGDWWRMGCKDAQNYCLGELSAGTYSSQFIAPRLDDPDVGWKAQFGALSYRVPAGWANSGDWPGVYELMPATEFGKIPASVPSRSIALATQPAPLAKNAGCESLAPEGRGRSVAELLAWLGDVPGLVTSTPKPITIAGDAGQQVDLRVDPTFTTGCHEGGQPLVEYQTAPYSGLLGTQQRQRVIYLDLGAGDVFSITIATEKPDIFEVFAAEAMTIMETLNFE